MRSRPDVIILCGGAGTRLRTVTGDAPKGMANVAGRPFLELLLQQLKRHGFTRIILAVGYQSDIIRSHFGENFPDLTLVYSTELRPLGTAGAIRNAAHLVTSENVLVMNGDSYTDVDLAKVVDDFAESKADVSVVVVSADDRSDCGFVMLDADRRVVSFNEKTCPSGARFVNAGIYVASIQTLREISAGRELSLEREVIPSWLTDGKYLKGYIHCGACIDIGTPDRYRSAQSLLAAVETNPSSARA
jgi:NDP-sugar pyrophosphorylase family protein